MGELVRACRHTVAPDLAAKVERLAQGPSMLERMEPARSHGERPWKPRDPVPRRLSANPRDDRARVERRDRRRDGGPGVPACPDEAGPARAEQPLVTAGDENVAAELCGRRRLDAEAVDTVHAQENSLRLPPSRVDRTQGVRDRTNRELDPGARVHPRDSEDTGFGTDRAADGRDDLVDGDVARVPVETDLPQMRAGSQRAQPQG